MIIIQQLLLICSGYVVVTYCFKLRYIFEAIIPKYYATANAYIYIVISDFQPYILYWGKVGRKCRSIISLSVVASPDCRGEGGWVWYNNRRWWLLVLSFIGKGAVFKGFFGLCKLLPSDGARTVDQPFKKGWVLGVGATSLSSKSVIIYQASIIVIFPFCSPAISVASDALWEHMRLDSWNTISGYHDIRIDSRFKFVHVKSLHLFFFQKYHSLDKNQTTVSGTKNNGRLQRTPARESTWSIETFIVHSRSSKSWCKG